MNKNIARLSLSIAGIVFTLTVFFQVKYLDKDYAYQKAEATHWHIHHDEKLVMPDARHLALKGRNGSEFSDYEPSSMASFGIGGPYLAVAGFKLFGLNNFGLRIFYLAISLAAALMVLLLIFSFDKGPLAFLFSIIYLANENNFALQRHAVIENVLLFYMLAVFCIYIYKNREFKQLLPLIAFAGSSLVLFKINYLFYFALLLVVIVLVDRYGRQSAVKTAVYFVAGIVFFGLLQFLVLKSLGISGQFISDIKNGVLQHLGVPIKISQSRIMEALPQAGASVFFVLPGIFLGSFLPGKMHLSDASLWGLLFSAALLVALGYFLYKPGDDPRFRMLKIMSAFTAAFIIFSLFFYFYIKRMIFIMPFLYLIFFAAAYQLYLRLSLVSQRLGKWFNVILFVAGSLLCANYIFARPMQLETQGSSLVAKNSRELSGLLPSGGKVFAHCYAYRFLWQAQDIRFISADDQVYSNFYILEKAANAKGEYVIFTDRLTAWTDDTDRVLADWLKGMSSGKPLSLEDDLIVRKKPFIRDTLSKIRSIVLLWRFSTTAVESDIPDTYSFYRLEYW